MSDPSVKGRTRRRAVRSVGPPPEDTREIVERDTAADSSEPVVLSKAVAVDVTVKADKVVATPVESASASAPARTTDLVDAEPKMGRPRWLLVAGAAVAAVVAIALVIGSGLFLYGLHNADVRDAQRADYVQTAKQAILNLTTINDSTAKADIDRVLAVASGELKAEYSQRKDAYASVVEQAKVKASGEIIESAIESEDGNSARVLVAAKQTLTNAGMADPQTRFYRFRVTVTRDDSGITASQVEFVA
ncbi:hypothetical protein OG874_38385 [Nocardia sp. NBC_00565]|uniref:hypothetical protein n=1 Tax=Nocardia sp. NBC_00565 TaxID=2975993 RepID=UPI002E8205EE|nr:hypothetical protein [Nocardia sp. NBC_00565]WUC02523.1 hypothetical protein OG874_38385 [Nocardia sp. NBC_00565]